MSEKTAAPPSGAHVQADAGAVWTKEEAAEQARRKAALTVSALLFAGIYLWGLIWGLTSLGQRKNDASASQG